MNYIALAQLQRVTAQNIDLAYALYNAIDNDDCVEDEQLNDWLLDANSAEINCMYDYLDDLLTTYEEEQAA